MKNTRKIVFTSLMLLSMTSFNTFADIPNSSVLIGNMTYDLEYGLDKKNFKEISASLRNNESDIILVKQNDGKWYENYMNKEFERYVIPEVIYKNKEGQTTSYDIFDGENIGDRQQFNIDNISVISENKLEIKFNRPISTNEFKGLISINDISLEENVFRLDKNRTSLVVELPTQLKKEDQIVSVKISKGIHSIYGDETKVDINKKILILNGEKDTIASELVGKEFEGDISVLSDNRTISELKVRGSVSVYAPKFSITNSTISESLEIENELESKIEIINSNINKLSLNAHKRTDISLDDSKIEKFNCTSYEKITLVANSNSEIRRLRVIGNLDVNINGKCRELIVDGEKNAINLRGKYDEVVLRGSSNLRLEKSSNVDVLNIASLNEKLNLVLGGTFNKINVYTEVSNLELEKNSIVKSLYSKYFIVIKGDESVKVLEVTGKTKLDSNINSEDEKYESDNDQEIYFVKFKELTPIEVLVGNKLIIPEKVQAIYSDNSVKEYGVSWNSKNVDIFKPGTYKVQGYVKDLNKNVTIDVNVVASLDIKEIPKLGDIVLEFGDVYSLPNRIPVILQTGERVDLRVEWDGTIDTNRPGVYDLIGTIYGTTETTTLKVTVKDYIELAQYWIKKPSYISYENILKSAIEGRVNLDSVSKVKAIVDNKEIEGLTVDTKGNFKVDVSELKVGTTITIKLYEKNGVEVDSLDIVKTI